MQTTSNATPITNATAAQNTPKQAVETEQVVQHLNVPAAKQAVNQAQNTADAATKQQATDQQGLDQANSDVKSDQAAVDTAQDNVNKAKQPGVIDNAQSQVTDAQNQVATDQSAANTAQKAATDATNDANAKQAVTNQAQTAANSANDAAKQDQTNVNNAQASADENKSATANAQNQINKDTTAKNNDQNEVNSLTGNANDLANKEATAKKAAATDQSNVDATNQKISQNTIDQKAQQTTIDNLEHDPMVALENGTHISMPANMTEANWEIAKAKGETFNQFMQGIIGNSNSEDPVYKANSLDSSALSNWKVQNNADGTVTWTPEQRQLIQNYVVWLINQYRAKFGTPAVTTDSTGMDAAVQKVINKVEADGITDTHDYDALAAGKVIAAEAMGGIDKNTEPSANMNDVFQQIEEDMTGMLFWDAAQGFGHCSILLSPAGTVNGDTNQIGVGLDKFGNMHILTTDPQAISSGAWNQFNPSPTEVGPTPTQAQIDAFEAKFKNGVIPGDISKDQAKIQAAKDALTTLQGQSATLQTQLAQYQAQLVKDNQDVAMYNPANVKANIAKLNSQIDMLNNDIAKQQGIVKDTEAKQANLDNAVTTVKSDLATKQATAQTADEKLASVKAISDAANAKATQAQNTLKAAQAKLATDQAALAKAKQTLSDLVNAPANLAKAQTALANAKQKVAELEKAVAQDNIDVKNAQAQLQAAQTAYYQAVAYQRAQDTLNNLQPNNSGYRPNGNGAYTGVSVNVANLPGATRNANGTYTIIENEEAIVVTANGSVISIDGVAVTNGLYINAHDQFTNANGMVVDPANYKLTSRLGSKHFAKELPQTGQAKTNDEVTILGMIAMLIATVLGMLGLGKFRKEI